MLVQTSDRHQPKTDHGWGILEYGSIALVTIVVLAIVEPWYVDCGKKSVAVETSNLQSIVTNAQQLKQVQGEYNFTSGTTMTGRLIQIGGTTKGMTVQGTTSSSTAMLWNSYGGQVVIAPVAVGFNNGFSVTSHKAPPGRLYRDYHQQYGIQ